MNIECNQSNENENQKLAPSIIEYSLYGIGLNLGHRFDERSTNDNGVGRERWQQHGAIVRAANDDNPTGKDV